MRELNEILAEFGQFSQEHWESLSPKEKIDYQYNKINYLASTEIWPPKYPEWVRIFDTYGIRVEEPIDNILYRINQTPRAFIKFAKLFSPQTEINTDMLKEKTLDLLKEKTNPEKFEFYGLLLDTPIINTNARIEDVQYVFNDVKRNFNTIEELYFNLPTIRYICETTTRQLKPPKNYRKEKWSRLEPSSALRIKEKEDWFVVNNALENSIKDMPQEQRDKIRPLLKTYYSKPSMQKLVGVYETLIGIRRETKDALTKKQQDIGMKVENYFNRLSYNLRKYYFEGSDGWVLYAPFKEALTDVLCETPTIEILSLQKRA
jgi:hypothetical protein